LDSRRLGDMPGCHYIALSFNSMYWIQSCHSSHLIHIVLCLSFNSMYWIPYRGPSKPYGAGYSFQFHVLDSQPRMKQGG